MTQAFPAPTTQGARVPLGIGPPNVLVFSIASPVAGPDLTTVTAGSIGVQQVANGGQLTWSLSIPSTSPAWQPSTSYVAGNNITPNPANGFYYTCTHGGTSGVSLSGTATVTNGNATVTFSAAQTLMGGQTVFFSSQAGVPYVISQPVTNGTVATLTTPYGGTTSSSATTVLPPAWPTTPGLSVTDNTVTWRCVNTIATPTSLLASHAFAVNDCTVLGPYELSVSLTTPSGIIPCYTTVIEVAQPFDCWAAQQPSLTLFTSVVF